MDNRGGEEVAVAEREAAALEKIGEELAAVLTDAEREIGTLVGGLKSWRGPRMWFWKVQPPWWDAPRERR